MQLSIDGTIEKPSAEMIEAGFKCPDPKHYNCHGQVVAVGRVVENPKHPDWFICKECHARFDDSGQWMDYVNINGKTGPSAGGPQIFVDFNKQFGEKEQPTVIPFDYKDIPW